MEPWVGHYDSDVAPSLEPYPEKTLVDYLRALAADHADKPALLFKGATVSYGRLEAESDAFGAALVAMGVLKGDRVALVLPNCPQFLVAEFGVWKAGGIVVALNPTYSERELEQALESTRALMVVVLTPFYDRIKRVQGRTAVRTVIPTSIKDYLPSTLRLLFTLLKEKKEGHRITPQPGDPWLWSLLRAHRGQRPSVPVGPDDRAVILSSGGTTGTPKGVVGLHRHYVAAGLQLHQWTKSAKKPWVDNVMLPLPLFHVYANVGVQPMAFVGTQPGGAGAESARHRRPAGHDQARAAGVLQRRAHALQRHPQPPRRARRQGGPELDQAVLLGRFGADGGDEETVRGGDWARASSRATRSPRA